jgi:hypothetical protein
MPKLQNLPNKKIMTTEELELSTKPESSADPAPDLRTSQEIAMTKHLENYEVQETDEDRAETVAQDTAALESAVAKLDPLPETLVDAHKQLQVVLAAEANGSHEQIVKKARLDRIMAHITALGNKPIALEQTPLCARSSDIIKSIKAKCTPQILSLKEKLLKYEKVREEMIEAALFPGARDRQIENCDREMASTVDMERIEELIRKKMRLAQITPAAARFGVLKLSEAFNAVEQPLRDLEQAIEFLLQGHDDEFIAAEREFFAKFGLDHVRTQVSDCVDRARANLKLTFREYNHLSSRFKSLENPIAPGTVPVFATNLNHSLFS